MQQIQHRECRGIPGWARAQAEAGTAVSSWRTKCSYAAALPWTQGQAGWQDWCPDIRHERFREDVSLPWKTAPVVSKPISPLLELPSQRSSLRYTTKRSRYFSLVKIARNLIFAITQSFERVERTSLQSFTLASLTFYFFGGNVSILMKLALEKSPLGQNRRERAVPGHGKSRRSFPFVPGLGFRPGCAPAPVGALARSRWLFCRGIFLWELLLHCTAN